MFSSFDQKKDDGKSFISLVQMFELMHFAKINLMNLLISSEVLIIVCDLANNALKFEVNLKINHRETVSNRSITAENRLINLKYQIQ